MLLKGRAMVTLLWTVLLLGCYGHRCPSTNRADQHATMHLIAHIRAEQWQNERVDLKKKRQVQNKFLSYSNYSVRRHLCPMGKNCCQSTLFSDSKVYISQI